LRLSSKLTTKSAHEQVCADVMSLHVVTYNNHVVAHLATTPSLARMSATGKIRLLKQLGNSRHREGPWLLAVELGLGGAKPASSLVLVWVV
jgi:hypothetical protein